MRQLLDTSNQHLFPRGKEKVSENDSLTVPDMAYTIREILQKFTTLPTGILNEANYEDDPDIEDGIKLDVDLTDITLNQLQIDELTQKLKSSKNKYLEEQKQKQKLQELADKKELEEYKELKKKAQKKQDSD